MIACTFFGHRDSPDGLKQRIKDAIIALIEEQGVDTFYVGNNGNFDSMAISAQSEIRNDRPYVDFTVVLAYLPKNGEHSTYDTLYPEGLELVPKRFAISKRNEWMIRRSVFIIAHVSRSGGSSARFLKMAERMGKRIYNLADKTRI